MPTSVPETWQQIDARRHVCHSWQDHDWRRITAMTFLIVFLAVATALAIEAVRLVLHDGPGAQRPPASHVDDPRFRSPGSFWSPGAFH
jgi:hypothetical protein